MIKNYFITAYRNLKRNKVYSFLNIFGLVLGITASILILEYVRLEQSYDGFHAKGNNIYRVKTDYIRGGKKIYDAASTFAGVGEALTKELPEVRQYVKLYNAGYWQNCVVNVDNHLFKEKKLLFATEAFFQMFSFPLLEGNPAKVLSVPNTVVISEKMSLKYFGGRNPVGKTISIKDDRFHSDLCVVTGVFQDIPENSHIKADLLVSFKTLFSRSDRRGRNGVEIYAHNWDYNLYHTYIQLAPKTNINALETRFPAIVDKYKPRYTATDKDGNRIRINHLGLQPLTSVHFESDLRYELEAGGNKQLTGFLQLIALFIILIAWINYINLSTARAVDRAREVGIRKVIGGVRRQLIGQFLLESLIINGIAVLIAIFVADLLMPFFSQIAGKTIQFTLWNNGLFSLALLGMLLLGALLTGLYPAFVLSSFEPVAVLKGKLARAGKGVALRKSLVVFQFAASVLLIAGTIAVYFQMQYLKKQDLGFDANQTLILQRPPVNDTARQVRENKFKRFKRDLLQNTGISHFTASNRVPGVRDLRGWAVAREKEKSSTATEGLKVIHFVVTDKDFLDTYKVGLTHGRKFTHKTADTTSVILTKAAVKEMGFKNAKTALGQTIYLFGRKPRKIVGITNDIHQESLEKEAFPMLFLAKKPGYLSESDYYSVKIRSKNLSATLSFVQKQWAQTYPGNPFEYYFLDSFFNRQYKTSQQFNTVFGLFSGLAIFVACLGLFGLASFTTLQRTKEVGIRKVMGASIHSIVWLLAQNFVQLLGIASAIALPLAYWGIRQWLQNFAYRINLGWCLFIIPLALVALLALITVSYQTLKTARANPVDSLRYE